jgi:hypothetical protein
MKKESERVKKWREAKGTMCPMCGVKIYYTSKTCRACSKVNKMRIFTIKNTPIGLYRKRMTEKGYHPSWLHAQVRQFARSWNGVLQTTPCQNCGYEKHVELCHKKRITSFSDDTLIGIINSPDNLLVLCPNCHWEYDNGLLQGFT